MGKTKINLGLGLVWDKNRDYCITIQINKNKARRWCIHICYISIIQMRVSPSFVKNRNITIVSKLVEHDFKFSFSSYIHSYTFIVLLSLYHKQPQFIWMQQTCELVNLNMISKRKGKIKRERFSSGLHSSVTYLFRRCTNWPACGTSADHKARRSASMRSWIVLYRARHRSSLAHARTQHQRHDHNIDK